jgi:hypothetical protein
MKTHWVVEVHNYTTAADKELNRGTEEQNP